MAQKQSKVEKLLKFLVNNENDKFTKNRDKLDTETATAFEAEVKLIDLCDQIWNQQEVTVAKDYFQAYVDATKGSFLSICQEAGVDPGAIRKRMESSISAILDEYPNKLVYSGTLVEAVKASGYELSDEVSKHLYDVHEEELWKDFVRNKNIPKCEKYLTEYADGKYKAEAMIEYNRLLFQTVQKSPSASNFKRFFDHDRLNTFFDGRSKRESMAQALSLYDDYLYGNICKAQAIASIKQAIAEYEQASYLSPSDKKYTNTLEYKKDSIDYETLKLEVNSPSKLGLIKEYLQTHKYKEFRDKANKLRVPFEQQLVWSNPTVIQSYSRGLLMKSNEVKNGKNTQKTYTYDENGRLVSIKEVIEDKGTTTLQTNFLYNPQGNCVEEVQVNQRGMKEVYKRLRTFSTLGIVLTDSTFHQNGKLTVRKYHPQLNLPTEETNYEKNVPVSSVVNQYGKNGQIVKREETFPLMKDPLPTQVSKQTDVYEYDPYGYLTKITFEKTLVNSEKTSGSLIFLYDEFGNQIDSNAYYEYDSTGRWIQKTDRGDAKNTEKIQVIYQ
ncbi:hypothetical protein KSY15_23660 [Bacteroides cellulosilyticus]|nr:hypothetical protein [Bacteroides cellulosilyticus]MBV3665457.1 hypothetical protein [Bacteroides cellulosilyticus]MBV3687525.1 hypothetical protein [Bacteroides cellulosilyticus]MBV3696226.1 hypothetical protein [Bacteroides cellulosilyticus]MBV3709792.1 hypothetical protein [Bacteroides cellulosilyticus]